MENFRVKAKKSLGQHFLIDRNIAEKIACAIKGEDMDAVLEIGPGRGILTGYLLERFNEQFYAIEKDREAVRFLQEKFPEISSRLIEGDFLKICLEEHVTGQIAVIGNFPYNISSQILFKVIHERKRIPEMAGMFQREVARRITASPGNKEYGILSVLTQAVYKVSYLFTVPQQVFSPPPKVKSGVIHLMRKPGELPVDYNLLSTVVKQAFNQRRKVMKNSLKSRVRENTHKFLLKRPEQLSVDDFFELCKWIEGVKL